MTSNIMLLLSTCTNVVGLSGTTICAVLSVEGNEASSKQILEKPHLHRGFAGSHQASTGLMR